jgi:hypothetical protein
MYEHGEALRFPRPEIKSDSTNFGTFFRGIECGPPHRASWLIAAVNISLREACVKRPSARLRIELIDG